MCRIPTAVPKIFSQTIHECNCCFINLSKRFEQNHFERLVAALQLETYICILQWLFYPNWWCQPAKLRGSRAEPELSMIFNEICTMFNWYKFLHSCQLGIERMFGFLWLLLWDVKNERVTGGTSFSGPSKPFLTYTVTPQRKIMDVLLFNFSSNFGPYKYKPFRIKGPFICISFQLTSSLIHVMG